MLKESEKLMKRGGEKVFGGLAFLAGNAIRLLDLMFIPLVRGGVHETRNSEATPPVPEAVSIGSMVIQVGPVPDELRRDPSPEGSVPWSILEAQKEQIWVQQMAVWKVATGVSWLITTVAALRALGIL